MSEPLSDGTRSFANHRESVPGAGQRRLDSELDANLSCTVFIWSCNSGHRSPRWEMQIR